MHAYWLALAVDDMQLGGVFAFQVCTESLKKVDEFSVLELWERAQAGTRSTVTCRPWAERASPRRSG